MDGQRDHIDLGGFLVADVDLAVLTAQLAFHTRVDDQLFRAVGGVFIKIALPFLGLHALPADPRGLAVRHPARVVLEHADFVKSQFKRLFFDVGERHLIGGAAVDVIMYVVIGFHFIQPFLPVPVFVRAGRAGGHGSRPAPRVPLRRKCACAALCPRVPARPAGS